jgi:protein subunit release factor A
MNKDDLTYRDFARFAAQSAEELSRNCTVEVFHASGPGGQGVNTSDSAVRMKHIPTGIIVTSRESRSQYRNRQLCLQKLRAIFQRKAMPPKVRHTTSIPRRTKEARLREKHVVARKKSARKRVEE